MGRAIRFRNAATPSVMTATAAAPSPSSSSFSPTTTTATTTTTTTTTTTATSSTRRSGLRSLPHGYVGAAMIISLLLFITPLLLCSDLATAASQPAAPKDQPAHFIGDIDGNLELIPASGGEVIIDNVNVLKKIDKLEATALAIGEKNKQMRALIDHLCGRMGGFGAYGSDECALMAAGPTCPSLSLPNGRVSGQCAGFIGGVCKYEACDEGYTFVRQDEMLFPTLEIGGISAPPLRTCTREGTWNGTAYSCRPGTKAQPCVGSWRNITIADIANISAANVKIDAVTTGSSDGGGLVMTAKALSYGCGPRPQSAHSISIKGRWTQIRYTQVFQGGPVSCYRIFGMPIVYDRIIDRSGRIHDYSSSVSVDGVDRSSAMLAPVVADEGLFGYTGVYIFDPNVDELVEQKNVDYARWGPQQCSHSNGHLWYHSSTTEVTATLMRQSPFKPAGISTITKCGRPTTIYKNIEVCDS